MVDFYTKMIFFQIFSIQDENTKKNLNVEK